ncbi:MAG: hypothetical protein ACHQPH_21060 [Reyranellales bacterium]
MHGYADHAQSWQDVAEGNMMELRLAGTGCAWLIEEAGSCTFVGVIRCGATGSSTSTASKPGRCPSIPARIAADPL